MSEAIGSWTFSQQTRDIQSFAEANLGITLLPHQLKIIDALASGKKIFLGKRAGFSTAKHVLQAYVEQSGGYIKHFDKTHFKAITVGDRKFVYCPNGNIISWSAGDYDHDYCEFCHKFFDEV